MAQIESDNVTVDQKSWEDMTTEEREAVRKSHRDLTKLCLVEFHHFSPDEAEIKFRNFMAMVKESWEVAKLSCEDPEELRDMRHDDLVLLINEPWFTACAIVDCDQHHTDIERNKYNTLCDQLGWPRL